VNDETTPEVGSQRTKQEGSAAPEQSATAPRTGAPNARNLAPGRTSRRARCGHQHLGAEVCGAGMRKSEQRTMKCAYVDLANRTALVRGKSGERPVHLIL
jgi:hypothetical protein